jgi:hypothetical protein
MRFISVRKAATIKAYKFLQMAACIGASALSTSAQLALNPGDAWTNSFNQLPFIGEYKIFPGDLREGIFSFTIAPGTFESGSVLYFELFEGGPFGAPRESGTVTTEPSQPVTIHSSFTWQDIAGSVRFTMVTGSCTVASVELGARVPNGPTYFNVYSTNFTPAPLAPRLQVLRLSNAVQISWWTNGSSGYVLESTNLLRSGVWPAAPVIPTVVARRHVVTVGWIGQQYFRLRK